MSRTLRSIITSPSLVREPWFSPEVAVRTVLAFERRFGKKHLELACHAALPSLLTPRLINLIHVNFLGDRSIDWVAEVDFLLSQLCRSIDEGLYELEPCVREVLLVELENFYGQQRAEEIKQEIAEFLWVYSHQKPEAGRSELRQTHEWIARAYLDPDGLVRELHNLLQDSVQEENSFLQAVNQTQVLKIVELLPDALEKSQHTTDYRNLIRDTRVVASVLYSQESITASKPETALLLSPPFIEWFNQSGKVEEKKIEEKIEERKVVEIPKAAEKKLPEEKKKEEKHPLTKESKIDFAIITAIELERQAVCRAFGMDDGDRVSRESRIYWQKSLDLKEGEFYNIVVAQCPDIAGVSVALLVADIVKHWHPQAVLLVGIVKGVDREKQQFGDLVIGRDVYYYPDGKRPEPIMYRADATLWSRIQAIPECLPLSTLVRPDGTQTHPTIHYGVIASGEMADSAVRDEITTRHREITAIEMEGSGLSAGAAWYPEPVRSLVIKAICDFADAQKNDEWQLYAAAVAAEFTKHFLLDRPLPPRNPPYPIAPPVDRRYELIVDSLKSGNLVPFLGPGINPSFYIHLAMSLTEFVKQDLFSMQQDSSNSSDELFMQMVMGSSLSEADLFPQDLPPESPSLREIEQTIDLESSPFYTSRSLMTAKKRLRYLSQYYILKNSLEMLYGKLYEILEVLEQTHQPSALHHFLAELPYLMATHNYPRRSPGLPFQLIVTTNYDDMLEQAFLAAQQPFDVVFYIADGDDQGKFKHHPYMGEPQLIEKDDSDHLPLRPPWGVSPQPRPIILKLFGTWETAWNNNFVATEQQMGYLVNVLKDYLPTGLFNALTKGNVLFMGYSPSDSDLLLLMNCLWRNHRIPSKSWLLHQAKPGDFEKELWKIRNVELIEMPSFVDDFVTQLQKAIRVRI